MMYENQVQCPFNGEYCLVNDSVCSEFDVAIPCSYIHNLVSNSGALLVIGNRGSGTFVRGSPISLTDFENLLNYPKNLQKRLSAPYFYYSDRTPIPMKYLVIVKDKKEKAWASRFFDIWAVLEKPKQAQAQYKDLYTQMELLNDVDHKLHIFNAQLTLETFARKSSGPNTATELDKLESVLRQWLRILPYEEYLRTNHWKRLREAALKRAEYQCQVCGKQKGNTILDVHHNTYKNLGEEKPEDLVVLCRDCHTLYHKKGKLPTWPN